MIKQTTPLISVYDGRQVLGFILSRGVKGYEAFSADTEESLGLYKTQAAAIDQLTKTQAPAHEAGA
jgi:hypothetical protein